MSTYLKIIVVTALFLSSGVVLGSEGTEQTSSITSEIRESEKSSPASEQSSQSHASESIKDFSEKTEISESKTATKPTDQYMNESAHASNSSESVVSQASTSNSAQSVTEESSKPAPNVNAAEPETVAAGSETQNEANPITTEMQANQLKINDQFISYLNAGQGNGQAIIDANPNIVATWGGMVEQSGNDGANTHFIGHNPGIFASLFAVNIGDTIEVSDRTNEVTSYTVSQIVTVNDSGISDDGTDYWDQITGTGGGERISLQTCINDDYNLIVFANK